MNALKTIRKESNHSLGFLHRRYLHGYRNSHGGTSTELSSILANAGLQLRKWASHRPSIVIEVSRGDKVKRIQGLSDCSYFAIKTLNHSRVIKQIILSEIAQILDSLGLIGPIIVHAKIILQQLWQLRVGWDESVS